MGSILTRTASVLGLAGIMTGAGTLTISDIHAADFYAGKKLTIIAGFRPGGGVDNNARIVGRHLGKHIPGNPSVINKNMPGAGGARLANWMFNKGKPDGLTIALPGRSCLVRAAGADGGGKPFRAGLLLDVRPADASQPQGPLAMQLSLAGKAAAAWCAHMREACPA